MKLRILTLALFVAGAAQAQTAPVANAGDDISENCAPPAGLTVMLDGSLSTDSDGDLDPPLAYLWTEDGETLSTEVMPELLFAPGVHTVTLTVDDGPDGTATDEVIVTIEADETPPEIVMAENGEVFFPPNHQTNPVEIADIVESVSDDCTEMTMDDVVFGLVTSDELDNGTGDGDTSEDVRFKDECHRARVRAERSGQGDGRVYVLHLQADDEAGNRGTNEYRVSVPHDRGHGHEAVEGAPVSEYFSACYDGNGPAACAETPSECAEASEASLSLKGGSKPALSFRATGDVPANGVPLVCLYDAEGNRVGGADSLSKLRVKGDSVSATAKSNVVVPGLPFDGALRAEFHAGDACVAASFEDAKQNETRYKARN